MIWGVKNPYFWVDTHIYLKTSTSDSLLTIKTLGTERYPFGPLFYLNNVLKTRILCNKLTEIGTPETVGSRENHLFFATQRDVNWHMFHVNIKTGEKTHKHKHVCMRLVSD